MGIKLSTKQAAPIIGVSPATLESWRCRNHPHQPPYYQVNGRVVYDLEETERWMQTCRIARRAA
jgi:hypothetical protein